jgi:DNA anti-recombination protein RmuC
MTRPTHENRLGREGESGVEPSVPIGEHDQPKPAAESETLHRSAGQEVDAILQAARNTAAKLREEAERARAEANAEAAHEVDAARRRAQSEREQAAKERAEAEAYAARLRSEAEAAAKNLRTDAQHEASRLVEAACARLIESARARVSEFEAEAKRHEERLVEVLSVCRGMTSRIQSVLDSEDALGSDVESPPRDRVAEPEGGHLDEALSPKTRSRPAAEGWEAR